MTSSFSLGKARHTLQRWLIGEPGRAQPSTGNDPIMTEPSLPKDIRDQRILSFMEEVKTGQQEWLCRVRMIRLDSIKERLGPKWEKLRGRVEIVAEKLIGDELSKRDRYLNLGNSEFIVFFANATPEESKIRALAIIEAIHEKFFGVDGSVEKIGRRVAECHVAHRDDFILAWETTGSLNEDGPSRTSVSEVLRDAFRGSAEVLDANDIAASAQAVIDSIILCCSASSNVQELMPALVRLKHLSRSLKKLDVALGGAKREVAHGAGCDDGVHVKPMPHRDFDNAFGAHRKPLDAAWNDIVELIAVLNVGPEHSHAELISALDQLRRARLARAVEDFAYEDASSTLFNTKAAGAGSFEYIPVHRSVNRGERIYQGIYRVNCRGKWENENSIVNDKAALVWQHSMSIERCALEHAFQYLLDHRKTMRCMLMVAVHINTLRGPHSQRRLSVVLRSAETRAKRRLFVEVVDYGEDDYTIATRRAIEELRLHSHAVFIRFSNKALNNLEKMVAECKRLGVHTIGIDVSHFHGRDAVGLQFLHRVFSLADQYSILVYVDGIYSVPILANAIARGASYVCAPALWPARSAPQEAEVTKLDDLYLSSTVSPPSCDTRGCNFSRLTQS